MTRQTDEPHTIRETKKPDIHRIGAEQPSVREFIEPTLTIPNFQEYRLVREFPASGGEADIWLILKEREYLILKHYRLGIEPKLEVLEKVFSISKSNPKNLVRILSYGFDEVSKRWYEIQEYVRNGSLKELMGNHQISRVQLRIIIAEISSALDALHQNNILHLDLKPSNILIRSIDPLNLILTDFGISTLLDTEFSRQITSTKGTPMYWAPEQLGNVVGKEADYWALGVIALEITQGRHPFSGMGHNIILATLATRGIIVPDDIHPDTAHLLKGLLTRNPRQRWGKKEVAEWLAGGQNIPGFYEQEHLTGQEQIQPYEFREEEFYNLRDLSYAFIRTTESWGDAKRHISRGYLTKWLEKTEKYGQAVEVEKYCELYPDEDERLLFITARFNPDIPFTLFGKPLDISSILQYYTRSQKQDNNDLESRIISMIFSGDLHRIYRIFSEISHQNDEESLISRIFTWQSANTGGIDKKNELFEYIRILKEREEIGPPQKWDAKAVLRMIDIRDLFLRQGYDHDSKKCEEDLGIATRQALSSDTIEPDLLVALASVSEEFGQIPAISPCLKKASRSDIRVVSLLFNKKTGKSRFKHYKRLKKEYETNIYSLSSEPWKEPVQFWKDLFFLLLSGGDFPSALSVSERIIEMNRVNADGWAMRGVSLARIGRGKEADYFLSSKIVQSSKSPLVWQLIGEYYLRINKSDEAEKNFLKGLKYNNTHTGSLYGLIKIYSSQKRFHEIITLCETTLIHDPDNQGLLLKKGDAEFALGRITQANGTYERYLSIAPSNTGVIKCLARCQIKLKKDSDAERSLNTLLELEKQDPQVFRLKAYHLLITGKVSEALPYLNKVLEIEPGDKWTLRIKADTHISLKEYCPAFNCIEGILTKDPNNDLFLEKKGNILLALGFFSDAAVPFKQAIDHGRKSADLYVKYGDALIGQIFSRYGLVKDQDLQNTSSLKWRVSTTYLDIWQSPDLTWEQIQIIGKATDWYDRAAAQSVEGASLWNRKGIVASILRDFDQAQDYFKRAISENKKQPAYFSNLAVMYMMKGDSDKGSALFLQGMIKFSKNPYFLNQCAGLYYQREKDMGAALDIIEQAVKINVTHDPIILYHKYLILRALKREEEGRDVKKAILSLDPGFILSDH